MNFVQVYSGAGQIHERNIWYSVCRRGQKRKLLGAKKRSDDDKDMNMLVSLAVERATNTTKNKSKKGNADLENENDVKHFHFPLSGV